MSVIQLPDTVKESSRILPLEPGDHLTRDEFERRYENMPELKKAELINGVVWMASPVRHDKHARPHAILIGWLFNYEIATLGVKTADNCTVRIDELHEPQPDALLYIEQAYGGKTRITDDDYLEGAPELVAEVASSSASFDLHAKKGMYRQYGVREYLVWRVLDECIDWFSLRDGNYVPLPVHADGYIESEVFPGLRLELGAMIRTDLVTVMRVLQEGVASPRHAAFVESLRKK